MEIIFFKKRLWIIVAMLFCILKINAQTNFFIGRFVNKEYNIFLEIDLYTNKILVPGFEILGETAGYIGDYKDGRKWLITNSIVNTNGISAELNIVNDYGSEDLKAELIKNRDNSYTLKQIKGSSLKIARNKKWIKLPKVLTFEIVNQRQR